MSIKRTSILAEYGDDLRAQSNRGQRAIDTLNALQSSLPNLKTAIGNDAELTAQDKTDAQAEVDAVITSLVTQIKNFANGLP